MPDRSRIPPKPSDYSTYIQSTDNHQLSIDPQTGNPRWMTWKWTAQESVQWTKFRKRNDKLYVTYASKSVKNTTVKESMHALIRETKDYDNHRSTGHRLLMKVAL